MVDEQGNETESLSGLDKARREFMEKAGKIAIYTPPVMMGLLIPGEHAIASGQYDASGAPARKKKAPKKKVAAKKKKAPAKKVAAKKKKAPAKKVAAAKKAPAKKAATKRG